MAPSAPITSTGSEMGDTVDCKVIVAVTVFVGSTTLAAVTITTCALLIVEGAVYTPFTILPTDALSDHVTAVLPVPATVAANVVNSPALRDADAGWTVTLTCLNEKMELGLLGGGDPVTAALGVPLAANRQGVARGIIASRTNSEIREDLNIRNLSADAVSRKEGGISLVFIGGPKGRQEPRILER
jgi:hypothetical protein